MEDQNQIPQNNSAEPNQNPAPKRTVVKKTLVEGINAPNSPIVSSKPLTEAEKKLVNEPTDRPRQRLLMQDIKKPSQPGILKWWLIIIILLAWGAAGWVLWYRLSTQAVNSVGPIVVGRNQNPNSSMPLPTIITIGTSSTSSVMSATSSPNSATTPQITTTTPATTLTIANSSTGYVNIRSQPSLNAAVIGKAHPGDAYTYTQTQNGWYQVVLPNSSSGWINGQYVTVSK